MALLEVKHKLIGHLLWHSVHLFSFRNKNYVARMSFKIVVWMTCRYWAPPAPPFSWIRCLSSPKACSLARSAFSRISLPSQTQNWFGSEKYRTRPPSSTSTIDRKGFRKRFSFFTKFVLIWIFFKFVSKILILKC